MNANTEQLAALIIGAMGAALSLWGTWHTLFARWRVLREEVPGDEVTERIPKYAERRPKLLVVAGTYWQYQYFCAESGLNRYHDAVYAHSVRQIEGLHNHRYVLLGTYWDQPQILEILEVLAYMECIPL